MSTEPLEVQVTQAVELLEQATKPGPEGKSHLLDPRLLDKAQALQFVFTQKTGVLLGLETGSGFTITRVSTNADGSANWSAPFFISTTSVSIGATIGKQNASLLSTVLSQDAVSYLRTHGAVGAYLNHEINLTLSEKWTTYGASLDALLGEDIVSVGLADGVLLDLSAGGGKLKPADKENAAVYGEGIRPEEVLGGGEKTVTAPPQFAPLYAKINEIILSTKVV